MLKVFGVMIQIGFYAFFKESCVRYLVLAQLDHQQFENAQISSQLKS